MVDELFSKRLPLNVKTADREERFVTVFQLTLLSLNSFLDFGVLEPS